MEHEGQRIRVAVQKSGRLTDHSVDLLERCGLKFTRSKDKLFCFGENMPIDLLLVRDDDIPGLVSDDVCDLGIVGRNVVEEKRLQMRLRLVEQHHALAGRHALARALGGLGEVDLERVAHVGALGGKIATGEPAAARIAGRGHRDAVSGWAPTPARWGSAPARRSTVPPSAGCASGEEAYSLAMLFSEQFDAMNKPPNFQIFASDIDEESLSIARMGIYPASNTANRGAK